MTTKTIATYRQKYSILFGKCISIERIRKSIQAMESEKLVHLPHQFERVIIFALYARYTLPNTIAISRETTIMNANNGNFVCDKTSANIPAPIANLSAIGSRIKPSSECCFSNRAKNPSNRSEIIATPPTTTASG